MTTSLHAAETPEVFPPTLREVMLRPRWLGMLAFALLVAAVFAWLGQWQLGRAIDVAPKDPGSTERVQPLASVTTPGAYVPEPLIGQKVSVAGRFVPEDFIVVSSRFNAGAEGFWVTGQFRIAASDTGTDRDASLAVAVGWTPSRETANQAAAALNAEPPRDMTVSGRLISDEGAALPPRGGPITEITAMSPAALLGRWHDTADLAVYRPYLASTSPLGGLTAIASPAPNEGTSVNWLNIFYAAEWAIFAGFAFYMWYRLAKDQWEKEVEELEDAAAEAPVTA